MTYRAIKIEEGTPTYASINSKTNTIYVSYTSSNFILVINLDKGTIERKIEASYPKNIVVNGATNKVYVSDSKNNLLYEIDAWMWIKFRIIPYYNS